MEPPSARPDVWFTIGPNANDPETVNALLRAGATAVRLTFGYGTPGLHEQFADMVHGAAAAVDRPCTVVADLAGEKVRLGAFADRDEFAVGDGERLRLVPGAASLDDSPRRVPVDSGRFLAEVAAGDELVVGDGSVVLSVTGTDGSGVDCVVEHAGTVNQGRGVVARATEFEPRTLTDEDREHLDYVAGSGAFDAVALSFVSSAEPIRRAREVLARADRDLPVISKVETAEGVANAAEIADASDAVMVARGDLGLYLPWQELGRHVETIVEAAREAGTPWILATQVAEGVGRFAFPTRAELCDLDRWAREGMDGVLLSHETAFGDDPVRAVATVREAVDDAVEASSG